MDTLCQVLNDTQYKAHGIWSLMLRENGYLIAGLYKLPLMSPRELIDIIYRSFSAQDQPSFNPGDLSSSEYRFSMLRRTGLLDRRNRLCATVLEMKIAVQATIMLSSSRK